MSYEKEKCAKYSHVTVMSKRDLLMEYITATVKNLRFPLYISR